MFELEKLYDGYVVKEYRCPGTIVGYYVSDYRKGNYKFTTDHAYAKRFTENTARKHADTLNERS